MDPLWLNLWLGSFVSANESLAQKKQNHLFVYIHENKMVKHLEEFLQNALSKNKSDAAFAAIILFKKEAALHTSLNIIVH